MKRAIIAFANSSLFFLLVIAGLSLMLIPSSYGQEENETSDDSAKTVEPVPIAPPPLGEPTTFKGHSWHVTSVAFSPDGRYALSGSWDITLKLWDVSTGHELRAFTGHGDTVYSVAFSPDGRYALSGNRDATLKLWDVSTGDELRTFTGHSDSVTSVAFSPDGRCALSGSWDFTLKLWNLGLS